MDKRSSLPEGANLSFPGNMECTVLAEEGRGSNAIVYRAEMHSFLNTSIRFL